MQIHNALLFLLGLVRVFGGVVPVRSAPRVIPPIDNCWAGDEAGAVIDVSSAGAIMSEWNSSRVAYKLRNDILHCTGFLYTVVELATINDLNGRDENGNLIYHVDPGTLMILVYQDTGMAKHSYKLSIGERIELVAPTEQDLVYASKTLLQMLLGGGATATGAVNPTIPVGTVVDQAQASIRWFYIDCATHYCAKSFLADLIRFMGLLKLNGLVLHGVGNSAFRFRLASHPGLAPVGQRREAEPLDEPVPWTYDRSFIVELVEVARGEGVDVIPSFNFLGASTVFNQYFGSAVPDSCFIRPNVTSLWLSDLRFESLRLKIISVLEEILPWFRSEYIHLGIGALPDVNNSNCTEIMDFMETNPRYGTFGDLVVDTINTVTDWIITTANKTPVVFSGLENTVQNFELDPRVVINVVDSFSLTVAAAPRRKLIVSANDDAEDFLIVRPSYFERAWPNLTYAFEDWKMPALPDDNRGQIMGVQMMQWSEHLYYMAEELLWDEVTLPLALHGARAWNTSVALPAAYGELSAFRRLIDEVVTPLRFPVLVDDEYVPPENAFNEIHHWTMNSHSTVRWPQLLTGCPPGLCLSVLDSIAGLHGVTYPEATLLGPPSIAFTKKAHYIEALQWSVNCTTAGVSLGGADLPPSWTVVSWVRIDPENEDPIALLSSKDRAILLAYGVEKTVALVQNWRDPDSTIIKRFIGGTIPTDDHFHHIVLSANASRVQLWLDREDYGVIALDDFRLPLLAIGGGGAPIAGDGPVQNYFAVDEMRVITGCVNTLQVVALYFMLPEMSATSVLNNGKGTGIIPVCINIVDPHECASDKAVTTPVLSLAALLGFLLLCA